VKSVIYFEVLTINQTVTAEVIFEKRPDLENRKDVTLLHDNARGHVSKLTDQIIEQFGCEVRAHPPSDFYLFLSLRNYLCNKYYEDIHELNFDLTAFFRIGTYLEGVGEGEGRSITLILTPTPIFA
jgi:hypothetical protein